MPKPIINMSEVPKIEHEHGEKYAAQFQFISKQIGAQKLGYRITTLLPGKTAWPFHHHHVNEEMFFILEGEGTVRHGDQKYAIKKGDFISAVPGGSNVGHQIINTSEHNLVYLCVSTMEDPDICEYPDSKKLAVFVGSAPGGDKAARALSGCWAKDDEIDYWRDED